MKLVSTSDGGADGSSMLFVINRVIKRPAIVKEQTTELSATTLFWSNEQQIFVQMKDTKHSLYAVLIHLNTFPYSADLHDDCLESTSVEHAAAVRYHCSVSSLQLFIVEQRHTQLKRFNHLKRNLQRSSHH